MDEQERKNDDDNLSDDEEDDYDDNDGEEEETSGPDIGSSSYDDFGRASTAGGDNDSQEEDNADAVSSFYASAARKKLPGHPNVVQIIRRPRTHVNHTYRDLSAIPNDGTYSLPGDIDRMSFPEKLFHLLASTSSYAQESIVWRPHGRAFRIKSEEYLQKYGLLKLYFGYARIQRFFKQLLNHDFKQITQGPDNGCFYNEYFLRGMPHLLPYFPQSLERRRLLPDPENEPKFADIAQLFYLPGDRRLIVQEARNRLQRRGIQIWDTVFDAVVDSAFVSGPIAEEHQPAQSPLIASLPSLPSTYAPYPPAGVPSAPMWTSASTVQGSLGIPPSSQLSYQRLGSSSIHSSMSGRSSSLRRATSDAAAGETEASATDYNSDQKPSSKKKTNRRKR